MKNFARILTLAAALMVAAGVHAQGGAQAQYQEGLHYVTIEGAPVRTSGKVEVVEAFSYLCSHCNTFEPYINAWKKRIPENVNFRRVPVVFGRGSWELYARGYVTAEMLGIADAAHTAMMDKLWKDKDIMRSMEDLAAFYSQFGVEAEKFLATSKSFAVDTQIKKDQLVLQSYGITGTPSLVVAGKYRVAGNAAVPSFDVMLDVVNFLVAKESAASPQSSAAAD